MARKISDYFKIKPKSNKTEKDIPVVFKVQECKIVLKDIKHQFGIKNFSLFDEVPVNKDNGCKNEKKVCKFCGKKMHSDVKEHIKKVHPTELDLIHCKFCNLKFVKNNFLESHMKKKHPNGQVERFECDFDGRVFKHKSELYRHMKVHFSLVKCEICDKMLKHSCMYLHMKGFHVNNKNFQCKICLKQFKSKYSLTFHVKVHNKEFKCEICNKMFTTNAMLNKHKKSIHENPKSFECKDCDKRFNVDRNLKKHQKTHDKTRPKPYKCQQCDYATDSKYKLKMHQNVHERQHKKIAAMVNPLKCEKCPTFHRSQAMLRQHMKLVHPKVLLQCDLCAKFIKTKYDLTKHFKVHILKLNNQTYNQ